MSNRALSESVKNTFVKGLITERAELTFPADASVDELNCDLRRTGIRRRREAVAIETDFSLSSFTTATDDLIWNGTWFNVGGNNEKEYEIVQVGDSLHFYDKTNAPFSGDEVTGLSVDLAPFEVVVSTGVANSRCHFASLNGLCVVVNPSMDAIFLEQDVAGTITASRITHKVRDFTRLSDRTALLEEASPVASVSDQRKYDTANSGWVGEKGVAALDAYIAANSAYPPLNLPWFSGKDANGDFSVTEWEKVQAGTSLLTGGHFILNFFAPDRKTVSGFTNIPSSIENSRFQTVASFAGRVFYAGLASSKNSGTILFSRQLDPLSSSTSVDTSGLGDCFSINDPTSEELSDVLDTDGGSVVINEAYNIRRLHVFNNSLFVLAENGIWQIKGVDDVFRATSFSVNKLTSVGLDSDGSFVSVDGVPFWWSEFGIHTMGFDQQSFQPSENNLSIDSIQTFFDEIDQDSRRKVSGRYDPINKRVFWAYPNDNETQTTKYNNFLILDIPLRAFYPWKVSDQASDTNSIVGLMYYTGIGSTLETFNVVSGSNNVIIDGGDNVISNQATGFQTGQPAIVLLIRDGATGKVTMGQFNGTDFLDWGDADYSSFAEAGFDFMGSLMLKKNVMYLEVVMRVTEEGFTEDSEGNYSAIRPSSLLVSPFWDFKKTAASQQQAYRLKRPVVVDSGDLSNFDYPDTVITTRLKLRGKGQSLKLKFESETGKDFALLGYSTLNASNRRP